MKSVLITGCTAGGIGHALAQVFQKRGLVVFATARDLTTLSALKVLPNVHLLKLDVMSPEDINAAVSFIKTTSGKLDFLVNNSGQQIVAPTIEVDIEQAKRLFEVNFWGVLRMTQAFLPLLMEAKGTVINIGSGLAHVHAPFMGVYCASKSAVHMIGEVLRVELAPLQVKVLTVVTGAIDTPFNAKASSKLAEHSKYLEYQDYLTSIERYEHTPKKTRPEDYANEVVAEIMSGTTGKIYKGQSASLVKWLIPFLPTSVIDSIMLKGSGLERFKS